MMKRTQRLLALFLAFFMLVALLPGSMALAAKWTPAAGEAATSDGFIKSIRSEQFMIGRDSNWFNHGSSFPSNAMISKKYLNQLLSLADYIGQCEIIKHMNGEWGGSCFGIAATMVLNRLSRDKYLPDGKRLDIGQFQSGAKEYFDLKHPKDNLELFSMINYHQLWTSILYIDELFATHVALEYDYSEEAVHEFVEWAKAEIDEGRPYMLSYATSSVGGHVLVGTDYYEYTENGQKHLILKFYDANDRDLDQDPQEMTFNYMEFVVNAIGHYDTPYTNYKFKLFDIDQYGEPRGTKLSDITYYDIKTANDYLNIHNPQPLAPTPTGPVLEFPNIVSTYEQYRIRPFGGSMEDPIYDEEKDCFFGRTDDNLPRPVLADKTTPYPHMVEKSMRYTQYTADKDTPSVGIAFEMKAEGFAGYDVDILKKGVKSSFSMSKSLGTDAGSYTSVEGNNLNGAQFDKDGKLHLIWTAKDASGVTQPGDLQLSVSTRGTDDNYDLFSLNMNKFTFLQLAQDARYGGDVLLNSDGFENGLRFQFFKNALQSDVITGEADKDDAWLRISSKEVDGKVEVSVWSAKATEDGSVPTFPAKPDYTTIIDDPLTPGGSESSGGSLNTGAQEVSRNEYSLANGQSELSYVGSGDFTFTVDAPFANYISTSIDGVPVERQFVDVKEGSTVITIREGFMKTLQAGKHRLRVQFTDGFMQTTLNVGAASAPATLPVPNVPATGSTVSMGLAMLCASLASAAFVADNKRRK